MGTTLVTVALTALASIVVALVTVQLNTRHSRRMADQVERKALNATYLNPLRFHVADSHYRIWDVLRREWAREQLLSVTSRWAAEGLQFSAADERALSA